MGECFYRETLRQISEFSLHRNAHAIQSRLMPSHPIPSRPRTSIILYVKCGVVGLVDGECDIGRALGIADDAHERSAIT